MKKLTDDLLERLAPTLPPKLQELKLHLTRCEEVTDKGLQAICGYIPKALNFLLFSLHGCTKITDVALAQMAEALPSSMQRLRLSFGLCKSISNAGLQKLSATKAFSSLKSLILDFDGCSHLGDEGMVAICNTLPASLDMLKFNIMGCHGVTDKTLKALSTQIPALQHLDLCCFACHDITDEGALVLAAHLPKTLHRFALDLRGTGVTETAMAAMVSDDLKVVDWYFQKGDITKHIDSLEGLRELKPLAGAAGSALRKNP